MESQSSVRFSDRWTAGGACLQNKRARKSMADKEVGREAEQALQGQLASLEGQAQQLSALVGDDPQSPLIPLQVRLMCSYK